MLKEYPVLFSGPMVKAILEGRKTQTRRVIKPQPDRHFVFMPLSTELAGIGDPLKGWKICPYGQPGDRLWVRETWAEIPIIPCPEQGNVIYKSTDNQPTSTNFKWKPSIHMPRWASRIDLDLTGVRVERVQGITPTEILKEGAPPDIKCGNTFEWFKELWDSINAKRGAGWSVNPWVWVLEFKRRE